MKVNLAKVEAAKNAKILKPKQDLEKEEEKERKKLLALEKQQRKEQIAFQTKLQAEIQRTARTQHIVVGEYIMDKSLQVVEYDLFISHASEDKEEFVRPLAETLENLGVKVWYDEFTLRVGDSLNPTLNIESD